MTAKGEHNGDYGNNNNINNHDAFFNYYSDVPYINIQEDVFCEFLLLILLGYGSDNKIIQNNIDRKSRASIKFPYHPNNCQQSVTDMQQALRPFAREILAFDKMKSDNDIPELEADNNMSLQESALHIKHHITQSSIAREFLQEVSNTVLDYHLMRHAIQESVIFKTYSGGKKTHLPGG